MSKLLSRLGTKKQVYSYDITIHTLQLALSLPVRINVIWKRRKKRIETRYKHPLSPSAGSVEINETLTMINTLYQEKSGKFNRKKATLTVQAIIDERGAKKIGCLTLNISEFQAYPMKMQYFSLESCPDKTAKICISIRAQPLGEAVATDTVSEASGVSGISMGTEGDYKGPLFLDQDALADQEEALAPKIIQGSQNKPPILKPPPMKLPESNFVIKKENDEESKRLLDTRAKISILEKENTQLRSEKEDLKVQLGVALEKSNKERENNFGLIQNLDKELQETKKKWEKSSKKISKREEKISKLKSVNERLLEDLKETEKTVNEGALDKERLRNDNWKLRESLRDAIDKSNKFQKQLEMVNDENIMLKANLENIQQQNIDLQTNFENFRKISAENSDSIVGAVPASYKRNSENYTKTLKMQLETANREREEALSLQTELTLQIQKYKTEKMKIEEKYKDDLEKFEKEIEKLSEENYELKQKNGQDSLDRKMQKRKTLIQNEDIDLKMRRLTQNFHEIKNKKEELEQVVADYEVKLNQRNTEYQSGYLDLQYIKEQVENKEKEIKKLKNELREKEKEINDIYSSKEILENENCVLREQMKKLTETEFSDPATFIMQEQIHELENRVTTQEFAFNQEKSSLREQIDILEKQLEILEEAKQKDSKNFEDQIGKVLVQNRLLKQQIEDSKINTLSEEKTKNSTMVKLIEENYSQNIQMYQLENNDLKARLKKLEEDYKIIEKKYLDLKFSIANSEMAKENLEKKYKEAQEQMRDYSSQFTAMEVELYKVNERFGETLNLNNELEGKIHKLKQKLKAIKN